MLALVLGLFTTPATISAWQHMAMFGPLCLSISIVYKTLRCEDLTRVPVASLALCLTIIVSMYAVGVGVWLLYVILA